MADTKKEYTSNLHPKGDMDTTVYPNVKSENIIDKDTTAYTAGKVPDSSLVSKSLDGISENLETTKIQVSTNKTNIATLQGDVSTLKQDNQTTKTTIAGLVSADTTNKANIAKNTQDIATLKANYTEVQSQANTNSSNIALLESNAIKKDTDASLKSLTLPSAKDLKTKDGTSFGGVDLTSDQTIDGNKTFSKPINVHEIKVFSANNSFKYAVIRPNDGSGTGLNFDLGWIVGYSTSGLYLGTVKFNYDTQIICFGSRTLAFNGFLSVQIDGKKIATVDKLDAKQSTLYRHTITIGLFTDASDKRLLVMSHLSARNTKISSIQDLIYLFKNTSLSCICTHETTIHISDTVDNIYINNVTHSKINIGNTLDEITLNTASDLEEELFTDVFGTTGFTITDNVTAM